MEMLEDSRVKKQRQATVSSPQAERGKSPVLSGAATGQVCRGERRRKMVVCVCVCVCVCVYTTHSAKSFCHHFSPGCKVHL